MKPGKGLIALLFITRYFPESISVSVQKHPKALSAFTNLRSHVNWLCSAADFTRGPGRRTVFILSLEFWLSSVLNLLIRASSASPRATCLKCHPFPNSQAARPAQRSVGGCGDPGL